MEMKTDMTILLIGILISIFIGVIFGIDPSQEYPFLSWDLESKLIDSGLVHNATVQNILFKLEHSRLPHIVESLLSRLKLILDQDDLESIRKPDLFRPLLPFSFSRLGPLLLTILMNYMKVFIDTDFLRTYLLLVGPPGSGKTYFLIHLLQAFTIFRPDVTITIIDPKNGLSTLAPFINAVPIDLASVSFDLTPPPSISREKYVLEFMSTLAGDTGLIYGLDLLNKAARICLEKRDRYASQTGEACEICFKDLLYELDRMQFKNFRLQGYLDATKTGIGLIVDNSNLFACRQSLHPSWLFSRNNILNARGLTNSFQSKSFLNLLLYWLYQNARHLPETNQIHHLIVIDDGNRFLESNRSADGNISPLAHMLATLRSTGTAVILVSHLPAQIDPPLVSLCRNMIVTGNIHGNENLSVIRNFMSLSDPQTAAITRFQNREMLAFIADHPWRRPIHGWTPPVPDLPITSSLNNDLSYRIKPWHPLDQLPSVSVTPPSNPPAQAQPKDPTPIISDKYDRLVFDCITHRFVTSSERIPNFASVREFQAALKTALSANLLTQISVGRVKYLVPTKAAYEKFNIHSPYLRSVSLEHSFLVDLAAYFIQRGSKYQVQSEVPHGSKGSTIDLVATDSAGIRFAIEVTLSTSNLLSNAARLQTAGFDKVIWLCRDYTTATAVKSFFQNSAVLPPDFTARFSFLNFAHLRQGNWEKLL